MNVSETVQQYLDQFPADRAALSLLLRQTDGGEPLQGRTNFTGHVTAAAIVFSPDLQKVLLIHHKFLGKWFQPGGHWDEGEVGPLAAARREAEEETSVRIARYVPLIPGRPDVPVHIDSHYIPANPKKGEPEHYHHDFRYVFVAADEGLSADADEVHGTAWRRLDGRDIPAELGVVLGRAHRLVN